MNTWEVELAGEDFDLEDLPQWFSDDACCVISRDGGFLLHSTLFNDQIDSKAVLEKAQSLVTLMNGAVKLCRANAMPFRVSGGLFRTNLGAGPDVYVNPPPAVHRFKPPGPPSTRPIQGLISLAQSDIRVAGVLDILGRARPSWPQMWVVFELVQNSSPHGTAIINSHPLKEQFRKTANNWTALGAESRHGVVERPPPKKPMPYSEALRFIAATSRTWIERLLSSAQDENSPSNEQ